jgi:hypothetical protein
MFRSILAVIAAITSSTCLAAFAQDNPYGGGTRLTGPAPAKIPTGSYSADDKARIVTQRFAACEIKAHRGAVLKAIQLEAWDANAGKLLAEVVNINCLDGGSLTMPAPLLRGIFYQLLYQEKFAANVPTLPETPLQIDAGDLSNMKDEQKTAIATQQFGDCVVRRDPQNSHALVMATPGSDAETAAVQALMPDFSSCVTRGATWKLNRSTVSAIISEVLYREASAAGATPSAG